MSLHINMTDEAASEILIQKRRNMLAAIMTAILGLSLLGIILLFAKVIIPAIQPPQLIPYIQEVENLPPSFTPPPLRQENHKPSAPPTNHTANIIQAVSPSNFAIYATVDTNDGDPTTALPDNFGAGIGNDIEGGQAPDLGSTQSGGSTLEGTFYDLKQSRDGVATDISPAQATAVMRDFITKNWDERMFSKYFKSPTKLYASQFYISLRSATEAPKAYQCADRVKDSRWCAIYRGKVVAPKSGKFRFVGAADDNVTVRFNNENVFDYGFYMLSLPRNAPLNAEIRNVMSGKTKNKGLEKQLADAGLNTPPVTFYQYTSSPHWNNSINGVACGKTFEVKAGEIYPVEILITEIPGGRFGVSLMIEEIGLEPSRKDTKTGAPVLPLFRTNYAQPSNESLKAGNMIPFDPIGVVWQSVK